MSRAVCTGALASFMVALAEVLAWLCFEVHVPPPQSPSSHVSACYTPSLFSAGGRSVTVAGLVRKGSIKWVDMPLKRMWLRWFVQMWNEVGDFTLGFKVAGDDEQHGVCLKFRWYWPSEHLNTSAGSGLCFLSCRICWSSCSRSSPLFFFFASAQ